MTFELLTCMVLAVALCALLAVELVALVALIPFLASALWRFFTER